MLKTLDRYIIGKFLSTFFFTVLIFVMIAVVIDFSEKVEKFIKEPVTTQEIALQYYPSFILWIVGLLWPLFTLIAVIFFTSRMAANSEIISIFNAGVSFRRFARPYFLGAGFLVSLHLLGSHFIIPNGNKALLDFTYTYIDKNQDKGRTRDVHLFVAPDTKVYIRNYRKRDSTARDFRIEQFENSELVKLIKAPRAEWVEATQKWRLTNYEIRTFSGMQEDLYIGTGESIDTTLNLGPEDFIDFRDQQNMMTTPQLRTYINRQEERGASNLRKYQLELARRTAEPVTVFLLTIIGMAIAARKVRGGIGIHLALGIGMGAVFIFLSRFSIVFAQGQSIPVWLGIWLPNMIFGVIAVFLVVRAQK